MRGKIRAATRFTKFKNDILLKFSDDASVMTEFIAFFRELDSAQYASMINKYCEEHDETLLFLESGPPTAIYQTLRITNRPILLRELEVLAEHFWGTNDGKRLLYTALSVLYGVNLIDYTLRDFRSTPANVVQFFVKEED